MNKKQILFLLPLLLFSLSFSRTYAESFTTGDANTSVYVETNTSGGKAETHISIEANGEKKVIDSLRDGKVEIKIDSSTTSSQIRNTIQPPSITSTQTVKKPTVTHKNKREKKTGIEQLMLNIEIMLKSFFK